MERYPKSVELRFALSEKVKTFERVLNIEAEEFYKKVNIDIKSDENNLFITIKAEDSSSLRAAMNSMLNWVGLMSELQNECGGRGDGRN